MRRDFNNSRFSFSHFLGDFAGEIMIFGDLTGDDFCWNLTGEALFDDFFGEDFYAVELFKDFLGDKLSNTLNGDPIIWDWRSFIGDLLFIIFSGEPIFCD